nr:hypothetical transcript [Hymenolepis microstoma]
MLLVKGNSAMRSSVEEMALTQNEKLLRIPRDTFWNSYKNGPRLLKTQVGLIQKAMEVKKRLQTTDKPESLSLPLKPLADNEVQFCTQRLGFSMRADTPPGQMRLLALETININYPADQWLQVFTDRSYVENQANGCAIGLPPRDASWATYTHTTKKYLNRQLTSNYHDPSVYHIRLLPKYLPHLFLSTFVSVFFTSVNHSSVPLSTFCDFDVPPSVKSEVN